MLTEQQIKDMAKKFAEDMIVSASKDKQDNLITKWGSLENAKEALTQKMEKMFEDLNK